MGAGDRGGAAWVRGCGVAVLVTAVSLMAAALGGCGAEGEAEGQGSGPSADRIAAFQPAPACDPVAEGPRSVEEGELLVLRLTCRETIAGVARAFRVNGLPPGAAFDQGAGTISFRPRLDQAGIHTASVEETGTGEKLSLAIAVADRFDHPENVPILRPVRYVEELGLPVLHLYTHPETTFDEYRTATIAYGGKVYAAEAKLRGNSSRSYPKKHFTLKFDRDDLFGDGARGFAPRRKIALTSSFDDVSHVRQRLAYETWNRVDEGKIRMQHMSVVVYLDGAYHGLYTITDHIDADLMAAHQLPADGNLYKSIGPAANFYARVPLPSVYEKKEGLPEAGAPGAFDDLQELTRFVSESDDATFRRQLDSVIDVRDHRAWLIAVTAIAAEDTLGKNAYHYHAPGRTPWRVVPWDFNHAFGQDWSTFRVRPTRDPDDMARENRLFARLVDDAVLGRETRARYAAALRAELSRRAMLTLVEEYAAAVAPSATRDERRWGSQRRSFDRWRDRPDPTEFVTEVAYIRRWIDERWTVLERKFASAGDERATSRRP